MRTLALTVIAFAAASLAALAADAPKVVTLPGGQFAYAMPSGSPVTFDKRLDQALVRFKGNFRIEGRYVYGRLSNDPRDDAAYDVILLTFVPDPQYRAVLPFWNGRGPVEELYFENEKEFLAKMIDPAIIRDIRARKRMSVTGRAAIWVDRYTAAFDCDNPTYTVRFLKADAPQTAVASNDLAKSSCL